MASFPDTGKIQNDFYKELIFPFCGAQRPEVKIGPAYGVDVAVIDLPGGMALALTSDPLSLIPSLGLRESAWLSVQLMANDMSTTGFAAMYAQFVLNLPPTLSTNDFKTYWGYLHEFCEQAGIAITGGHTGKILGQHSTVSGGGTMLTMAPAKNILTSKGASPGDVLIVTKECALLSTAILARSFPQTFMRALGGELHKQACDNFYETSAVEAGVTAGCFHRQTGSVTAMHDVTEGGVLGAVFELAHASECGVTVKVQDIPVGVAQQRVCQVVGIDPYYSVGAGAMLITVKPEAADGLTDRLTEAGIKATPIGTITGLSEGRHIIRDEKKYPLEHPGVDPYWNAFFDALNKGWK